MQKQKDFHLKMALKELFKAFGYEIEWQEEDLYVTEKFLAKPFSEEESLDFLKHSQKELKEYNETLRDKLNLREKEGEIKEALANPAKFSQEQWEAIQVFEKELKAYEENLEEDLKQIDKFTDAVGKYKERINALDLPNKENVNVEELNKIILDMDNDNALIVENLQPTHVKKHKVERKPSQWKQA